MPTTSCLSKKRGWSRGEKGRGLRYEKWGSPWVVVWRRRQGRTSEGKEHSCPSSCFPYPTPPPHPRKADEGLASLSEDGRSPISIRQMAYGEPRERGWRRELDTPPLRHGNQNHLRVLRGCCFSFIPDFQGEVGWRESRCRGTVPGNGARSLVIRAW